MFVGKIPMRPQQFQVYRTKIDDRGRIYIPKELRRKLKLKSGNTLYIVLFDKNEVKICTENRIKNFLRLNEKLASN